jgi:hypothetical protein
VSRQSPATCTATTARATSAACDHLIAAGVIPAKKVVGRVESRASWIAEVYAAPDRAEPDRPNGKGAK